MNVFVKGTVVLLSSVMLWGCSSTPKTTTAPVVGTQTAAPTVSAPTTSTMSGSDANAGTRIGMDQLSDPNSPLAKRTIYFDFDQSDIKPEARQIIEHHSKYLAANANTRIVLQGHADERGTREYNLSLGERRARAVQQVMTLMGVSASQLELVSYGEERPAAMGHDESAWALNRRVELIY